jgi:hypothetical protein
MTQMWFPYPVQLQPSTTYFAGFYLPDSVASLGLVQSTGFDHTHTAVFSTVAYTYKGERSGSGDVFPTTAKVDSNEFSLRLYFNGSGQSHRGYNAPIVGRGRRGIYTF